MYLLQATCKHEYELHIKNLVPPSRHIREIIQHNPQQTAHLRLTNENIAKLIRARSIKIAIKSPFTAAETDLGSPREGRTNWPLAGASDLVYTALALMTTFALLPFVKASENLTLKGTVPRLDP